MHHLDASIELMLTALSVGAAAAAALLAAAMYLGGAPRPSDLAAAFAGPYRWLSNKWYVDERIRRRCPSRRTPACTLGVDLGVTTAR